VVIELFGQPGAGKSTLVRAAADLKLQTTAQLGAAWRRRSIAAKGLIVGRAVLDGPCLAHAAALIIKERLWRADSIARLLRLIIKSHWLRSTGRRYLLEEGHLQELWSVFYSADRTDPDPRLLAPLIRCLYRGSDARIVFVDVDADLLFDRIRGRTHGKSRFDRLAERELRRQLATTARLPYRIADAARLAGLKVERLEGSQPIESLMNRLGVLMQGLENPAPERG
jgi:energy-coupling factor transporter ATP-binding protein EcfA2